MREFADVCLEREGKRHKLLLIAKCKFFVILLCMYGIEVDAGIMHQRLDFSFNNMSIVEALNVIKEKSGYDVFFQKEIFDSSIRVSKNFINVELRNVLDEILVNNGYVYEIVDNVIIIRKKAQASEQNNDDADIKVYGKVVDSKGFPLPGVTIVIKGSNFGVTTDTKGKFMISIKDVKNPVLVFSFIGMKTKEVAVIEGKELNIVMYEDVTKMEEHVVTGYGNVKTSSFTGNVVTIKKDDLLKVSKTNVIKAIQSFDPSFRIKENNEWGSDPNAIPEVYVRGMSGVGVKELDKNSLSKSNLVDNPNLPTFIMDGFEISVQKLYDFDPNRIESITILKDAAATALYGSRAANGVVVITTVTPQQGKLNVSYNFVGEVTMPDLSDYNLMNAEEKLETERIAGCYKADSFYEQYLYDQEYNAKLANVRKGVDTYWLSKPLQTAFNHKHSVYVDGGGNNFKYGFDINYNGQNGVMKKSYRDRLGVSFLFNYRINTFVIQNLVSFSQSDSQESPYGAFYTYTSALPYDVAKDSDGKLLEYLRDWTNVGQKKVNPLYEATLANFDRAQSDELINSLSLNWHITPALLLKSQLSFTKTNSEGKKFLDPKSRQNSKPLSNSNFSSGELSISNDKSHTFDFTAYLSFNKNIREHDINFLVGVNMKETVSKSSNELYRGFPSGELNSPNYAKEIIEKPKYIESTSRLVGFLGTLNYSYMNIYLTDLSIRFDGSSAFGSEKRFAPFWSLGLGLNIHNYDFLKDISWINMLRVRASYGQTGKANFPAYASKSSYVSLTEEWYKSTYGVVLKALGNKNLEWEKTNSFDIGAEIAILNNILYLKGSYYHKKTIDLINDVTIPSSSGFTTYKNNVGEVLNKGYEFDFRLQVLNDETCRLSINANIAHNKNKILKIAESLKDYNNRVMDFYNTTTYYEQKSTKPLTQYTEGGSLTSIWGVKSAGINPATGEEVFINPDGSRTDVWNSNNQVILGNSEPKGQGSFGLNLSYKQFTLYASFMFEFGGQRYNSTLVDKVENANVYLSNVDKRVLKDRWKNVGDKAKYKKLGEARKGVRYTRPTSRFVQDYRNLSFTSITLGYDLPRMMLEKLKLSMLRFELSTNDILHLSSVKQERGLSYPYAKTLNASVKISF